ncbi:MAG TPA: SIS domain-containing protein [bacterium]|nr:SIS domain-containing protein [bacterium]
MTDQTHKIPDDVREFIQQHPQVVEIVTDFINREPKLELVAAPLIRGYAVITNCFNSGGKLFLCGNGGSFADCLHISGEMLKSFERRRALSDEDRQIFLNFRHGYQLADAIEYGFPAIVLGLNPSLKTAVENDIRLPNLAFAQELFALGRKEDVLLGISTSGNAQNVSYAVSTAKAIGMHTIGLTGKAGGELAQQVDIALTVPATQTNRIQEMHQLVYHTLCAMIEAHYFQESKK